MRLLNSLRIAALALAKLPGDGRTMRKIYAVTALLGSLTTLFCCFLPVVFVSLGLGASFAGLVGAVPQLTWFSEHKGIVFLAGGVLIAIAAAVQWRSRYIACPIDPLLAEGCTTAKSWSKRILILATVLYGLGFLFAFVLPQFIS